MLLIEEIKTKRVTYVGTEEELLITKVSKKGILSYLWDRGNLHRVKQYLERLSIVLWRMLG